MNALRDRVNELEDELRKAINHNDKTELASSKLKEKIATYESDMNFVQTEYLEFKENYQNQTEKMD